MNPVQHFDTVILGSDLAALTTALHLAATQRVALVTCTDPSPGACPQACEGIAAMLGYPDSFQDHIRDTLVAGSSLNEPTAVARYSRDSAEAVSWLQHQGVPFALDATGLPLLSRDTGHSHRRVLQVDTQRGPTLQAHLFEKVRQSKVEVLPGRGLVQLLVRDKHCYGALVQDLRTGEGLQLYATRAVVVATEGAGSLFERTTNPDSATGAGIAACWAAGCALTNMEFVQFHPTRLYAPGHPAFLIPDTVRSGGHLLNTAGARFMAAYDKRLEGAPPAVVARAIHSEMARFKEPYTYLDLRHLGKEVVLRRFPLVYAECLARGIDVLHQPVPVSPIARYLSGGVQTDSNARTPVAGLYCAGESAYTGLHGAGRLAANAPLEWVVGGMAAARHIQEVAPDADGPPAFADLRLPASAPMVRRAEVVRAQLGLLMWRSAGLIRDEQALITAAKHVRSWTAEFFPDGQPCWKGAAVQALYSTLLCAQAVLAAASQRQNSIGCHYRSGYPTGPEILAPLSLPGIPAPA